MEAGEKANIQIEIISTHQPTVASDIPLRCKRGALHAKKAA